MGEEQGHRARRHRETPKNLKENEAKMCRDGPNRTPTQDCEKPRKHNRNTGDWKQRECHPCPQGKSSSQQSTIEERLYTNVEQNPYTTEGGPEKGAPKGHHRKWQEKQNPDTPASNNQVQEGESAPLEPEGKEGRHIETYGPTPHRVQCNNEGGMGTTTNKSKGSTPGTTTGKGKAREHAAQTSVTTV
ncbi:hypothetical protein NDU88_001508 [Pleurodeles waltl]|uniref:Uncharacterized protein n=1 Tax=Pleurodeles waltl TaxID=8319 RepID=A0AAV7R9A6_PLEWA|nr:hypothetical protein NDU88_001508 [Pleurodeles waltl]